MQSLQKIARPFALITLLALLCLFSFYLFPHYHAKMIGNTSTHLRSLDGSLTYTYTDVVTLFNTIGAPGRKVYHFIESRIDMIFPLIYGPFCILLLAFLFGKIGKAESKAFYLSLLPLITIVADYCENFHILKLLDLFPNITARQVGLTLIFTEIKWGIIILSTALALVLGIIWAVKAVRK